MGNLRRETVRLGAGDVSYPAANTPAVVSYGAAQTQTHCVYRIVASYSGTPTGGRLSVTDGAQTIFDVDIIAGGPVGPQRAGFDFDPAIEGLVNQAMVITLAAGGAGIVGKLEVHHRIGP